MTRLLLQVDDELGAASVIVDHELTDDERAVLEPLLAELPANVAPEHLLAVLIRQVADEQAYDRVRASRGLLW